MPHPRRPDHRRRHAPPLRQGPRPLRAVRRAPADGRQRPDLGVRLHPRRRPSPTRARSSPGCRCGGSSGSPAWCLTTCSRPTCRPRSRGRAVICERLEMFPVECVARGYLTGSGLLDYRATGEVCGIALPPGLEDGSRLPEPIFTPADEGRPRRARRERLVRRGRADRRRRRRRRAADAHAGRLRTGRGASPATAGSCWPTPSSSSDVDPTARSVLADEVLTPDSSRFWPADDWHPGRAQPSYDKQIVRDWLLSPASGWDRYVRRGAAAAARRGGGADPGALPRGLRDPDRRDVVTA